MTNRINRRGMLAAVCGLALVGLITATPGNAGEDSGRRVELTFSKAFSLPGVTLHAGTYVFERAAPQTAIDVVRVSSQDNRFVYYQGFTDLVERPSGNRSPITFGEAPAGGAPPVRDWYPAGTSTGHRFRYR